MRGDFGADHENDDDGDDPEGLLVVEDVDLHPDEHPESSRADETQHRGCAKHRIPVVDDDAGPRRPHLGQHRVHEGADPVRTGRTERFHRPHVDGLHLLGHELAGESDRQQGQRDGAGDGTESQDLHQQHAPDDDRDGTRDDEHPSSERIEDAPVGGDVPRREPGDGNRDHGSESRAEERHLYRLEDGEHDLIGDRVLKVGGEQAGGDPRPHPAEHLGETLDRDAQILHAPERQGEQTDSRDEPGDSGRAPIGVIPFARHAHVAARDATHDGPPRRRSIWRVFGWRRAPPS